MKSRAPVIAAAIAASGLTLALNAIGAPDRYLPETHKQGEVTYIAGGIGQAEADAIKHAAKFYPLELEFLLKAKPKDEYLADVNVRIKDTHDNIVLNVTSDGPFLLAKMPAGKYTVSAEQNGRVEHREIVIAAKEHRRIVFEWQS
ncbi:MAG: carboxypeptidase-like regulatory domain-containing protein [Methylococcales bacterium]